MVEGAAGYFGFRKTYRKLVNKRGFELLFWVNFVV